MIQFYSPEIEVNPVLPESDSQHCIKVLRMRMGDMVEVVDGKGHRFKCRIADDHPKHAMLEIIEKIDAPLPWQQQITVAVAPTKHIDRMEWLVEKLVEVGVNQIVPLKCRYSERKEIKEERLRKIAVSAMKQSLKSVMPEVTPMIAIDKFVREFCAEQKYIAYCAPDIPRNELTSVYQPFKSVGIMIGPEGDFSGEEIKMSLDDGYVPVTLGENRLRTETAALYACSAFHIIDSIKSI